MTKKRTFPITTKSRRAAQVTLCKGCCCGRIDRGHPEVPVDRLKAAWKEHGLRKSVQLTVSGCLGPCDVSNVVHLMTRQGEVWLGGLDGDRDYDLLVDWARDVAERGSDAPLPDGLGEQVFERWADDG